MPRKNIFPLIQIYRVSDELRISVAREACAECGEPVHVSNYSPTDGDAYCACCVEGSELCAAEDMRGDVRAMLVAAIALIDAGNGAPSECTHEIVGVEGNLDGQIDIPHCLRCRLPLRRETQPDGSDAYVMTSPQGAKVLYLFPGSVP